MEGERDMVTEIGRRHATWPACGSMLSFTAAILFTAVSQTWWVGLSVAQEGPPPLDCPGGAVCRDPQTFLPGRLLTRPFSNIYTTANESQDNILADNVTAFTPLYIFAREGVDMSDPRNPTGWYQVGETATVEPTGWMQAKDVVEWRQALIVAFSHPGVGEDQRQSVLFFETLDDLAALTELEDAYREKQAESMQVAVEAAVAGNGEAPEGIVSVEPGPFVDITEQFYMLPVLQFEDLGDLFLDEARHLQVVAVTGSRAEEGESALPTSTVGDTAATLPDGTSIADAAALEELKVDIVFVMDMTASMAPFIETAASAVSDMAHLITEDAKLKEKVKFGLVGYRDDVAAVAEVEFLAESFTDNATVDVESFLLKMEDVVPMMMQFANEGRSSGDYQEEVFAGVKEALATSWSEPSLKFMVLVGDASSHMVGHPQNTTGLNAEQVRQLLDQAQVYAMALHIREDRADTDHPIAEAQFSELSTNPGRPTPYYYSVDAYDRDAYQIAIKEIAEGFAELGQTLSEGSVPVLSGAPSPGQQQSSGAAVAGKAAFAAAVAELGAAAVLPYLGKATTPPRDFTAWVFDRDLQDPTRPSLDVRVLLTKEQVNDLVFTAEKVSQALKRAELTQMQFFDALQSVATTTSKGEDIAYGSVERLSESGLAPSWIASLPYKSDILSLNNDLYASLSPDERAMIELDLDAKLERYRQLIESDDWMALSDRSAEIDKVYPLELAALP